MILLDVVGPSWNAVSNFRDVWQSNDLALVPYFIHESPFGNLLLNQKIVKSNFDLACKLTTVWTYWKNHSILIFTFHLLLMLMVEINKLFWQDSFIHLTDCKNLLIGIRCCTWQNINFSLPFLLSFSWSPFLFLYSPSFLLKNI